MATSAIYIQWGLPVPGRERMALEEFGSYLQWANQLQAQGKIERVGVFTMRTGNLQRASGYTIMEAGDKEIAAIADSDDFRARTQRVMTVVQNLEVEVCDAGPGALDHMKRYGAALQQLKL